MNQIGMKKLTDRQRELLNGMVVGRESNVATFSGPQIDDWKALKTVMVALGGQWKRGKGFAFPDDVDAAEVMRIARETGVIFDPREADFFETPAELVETMCSWAELTAGMTVLEPSAGKGAIAVMAAEGYGCRVQCVEALEQNVVQLSRHGLSVSHEDFLSCAGLIAGVESFDRVLMNPPFSSRADITHVARAMRFLKRGGVLVAIMSAGIEFRDDRMTREFKAMLEANSGELRRNPEGSFKRSGTMVRTVMVKMRKAG